MKIKAYAKVNLALDVVRKREDGYHDLEMIMAPITLHDLIYINTVDSGVEIDSNAKMLPKGKKNIMYKVYYLMKERYNLQKGVKIFIYKHIPSQAGLAGGSADGAAVIKAINILFHLNLSYKDMAELGKEIGADIPFCIYQRTSFVEGIGEKIQFIDTPLDVKLLLVKPSKGVSTKKAFESLDFDKAIHPNCKEMLQAINNKDYQGILDNLANTLEQPSIEMVPDIEIIKKKMLDLGFDGALMSGSGSCVFGITRNEKILDEGHKYFKEHYRTVRKCEIFNNENK
ncbi:MAG: 4-(cytidine 5'-diphospho)-2-C-methyl-D-erythritol kinase [Thomasclavelia sp.]|nr:4-(cytidine 5'-diphospho)-2-C-methyl-D-erythritol kinase [Thomasclavelia sp.]